MLFYFKYTYLITVIKVAQFLLAQKDDKTFTKNLLH